MSHLWRSTTLLALVLFPFNLFAGDFLWRVRTNDSVVYLLGSIHKLRARDVNNPPFPIASFEQAFSESQQVVLESNPDPGNPTAVDNYVRQKGFLPFGSTIRDYLSPTDYEKLRSFASWQGLRPEAFDPMQPWLVASGISYFQSRALGFRSAYGIDERYYNLAINNAKPVFFLETPYQQINILAGTPQHEWASGIGPQIDGGGRGLIWLVGRYRAGDVSTLNRVEAQSAAESPGISYALLTLRNRRWVPKIEMYLQQSRTTLVVVGAAHMVRPTGLVNLLRRRGYDVKQMPETPQLISEAVALAE